MERYSEPYVLSMAVDEAGADNPATGIDFNVLLFPNVRVGDTIDFDGQEHLIYRPKNPGAFLAYSVLFMESDTDLRANGNSIQQLLQAEAVRIGIKALLAAAPTYATAVNLLTQLTNFISRRMAQDKDDELFRKNGTLLHDVTPAFDILRTYTGENDFIESKFSIIPLDSSNRLGEGTKELDVTKGGN